MQTPSSSLGKSSLGKSSLGKSSLGKKLFFAFFIGSISIAIVGALAGRSMFDKRADKAIGAFTSDVAAHAKAFQQDRALLMKHPLFASLGTAHDAGPFLNPRLAWEGEKVSTTPEKTISLTLPHEVSTALQGKNWRQTEFDVATLDTHWMQELSGFDHWAIEKNSPLATYDGPLLLAPIPHFSVLIQWAKIRLLQGVHADQQHAGQQHAGQQHDDKPPVGLAPSETPSTLKQARAEVRHLASLCASTELMIGALVGASIDDLQASLDPATAKTTAPATKTSPLQRAVLASGAFASIFAPANARDRLPGDSAFDCAGIAEAAALAIPFRGLLDDTQAEGFAGLAKQLKTSQGHCRLTLIRSRFLKPPPTALQAIGPLLCGLEGSQQECPFTVKFAMHIPGIPSAVGRAMASITLPNYFSGYAPVEDTALPMGQASKAGAPSDLTAPK